MADEAASNSRVTELSLAFAESLNQRAIPINGETGQQLRKLSNANFDVGWTFAGTGDVTGPGVSVDGALAVFDGTDGLTIKEGPFGTLNQVLTSNGPGVAPSFQTPAGSGTVTSVNASGGTTGLTFSGGPITGAGTLTLGGTLAPANGGTGITALGTGVATFLGTPSSANLAAAVTDETGSGALVFATSPTLVTPALGTPASGVLTNTTGLPLATGVTGTLPVANGGTGVATISANGVMIGAGTSAVTTVAPGTSGNVLTSNGSAWVSSAPAGGATWTQIGATQTVSGSPTNVDFTSIPSTYGELFLDISNANHNDTGTGHVLRLNFSVDNGSTFPSGTNCDCSDSGDGSATFAGGILIPRYAGVGGHIVAAVKAGMTSPAASNPAVPVRAILNATAINALRLSFPGTTFLSGTIKLWGK